MKRVAIIGGGKLGTSLGAALRRAGHEVSAVTCLRKASARESARLIGRAAPFTDNARAAELGDIVFICLPDRTIAAAANELARAAIRFSGKTVFHTSGALPASALAPLRRRGAFVASFHPVQSFARKDGGADLFAGIAVALEGDPKAVAEGRRIVKSLGGRPLLLSAGQKAAFHAACSIVSNYLVVLFDMAEAALRGAGIKNRDALGALVPLAKGTLLNVKNIDAARVLTGPIARGDAETVARHLRTLGRLPRYKNAYRTLGQIALGLAARRGLPPERIRALRLLLGGGQPPPRVRRRTGSGPSP
jgi:predicted short-subunit dehydrogenase-like oxidoreductase (DUF2520 family)